MGRLCFPGRMQVEQLYLQHRSVIQTYHLLPSLQGASPASAGCCMAEDHHQHITTLCSLWRVLPHTSQSCMGPCGKLQKLTLVPVPSLPSGAGGSSQSWAQPVSTSTRLHFKKLQRRGGWAGKISFPTTACRYPG